MNRAMNGLALSAMFFFVTCQDAKEDLKKPVSEIDSYKTIGEEIPFDTGMEWIKYYKDQRSGEGRTESLSAYHLTSEQLDALLQSAPELIGIAFHHAIDEGGTRHIIAIPVDESLTLWGTAEGRIIVDSNTGSVLTQEVAASWAQNFKSLNPSGIWFHFFGKNIFDQMRALPYFDIVELEPAISMLDLTPQLLLVAYNDDLVTLGRTNYSRGAVYDASNACPPCAMR